MDNKMPFLPQETRRAQRVEVYLEDLKARLRGLREQHDEVIQHSVDIIKEIDQVSSSLLLPTAKIGALEKQQPSERTSNIKQLIQEFETIKLPPHTSSVSIDSTVSIRSILQNFEQLSECHLLKDSLVLFKRARESFDKIDNILETKTQHISNNRHSVQVPLMTEKKDVVSKDECESQVRGSSPTHYASCCSSVVSIDTFHSTIDMAKPPAAASSTTNSFETGYDGDNDDSEYDLFVIKQKKLKLTK